MSSIATKFDNVTAIAKANVYFDGKVVSHAIFLQNGAKKTMGLIVPGKYRFVTDKAERMEIIAGRCAVKIDGHEHTTFHPLGTAFEVAPKSGFEIEVPSGICEYICSFID